MFTIKDKIIDVLHAHIDHCHLVNGHVCTKHLLQCFLTAVHVYNFVWSPDILSFFILPLYKMYSIALQLFHTHP